MYCFLLYYLSLLVIYVIYIIYEYIYFYRGRAAYDYIFLQMGDKGKKFGIQYIDIDIDYCFYYFK